MTVNILGREYSVKISKMPKDIYGECDMEKRIIKVNKQKGDLDVTLIHEILHAILYESGVRFLLDHQEGLEETIVRAIEHGLESAGLIPEIQIDDFVDPKFSGQDNPIDGMAAS